LNKPQTLSQRLFAIDFVLNYLRWSKAMVMVLNLHEALRNFPAFSRQLPCKDLMFTRYECQQPTKAQQFFLQSNFIVYVLCGKRIFIKNKKLGDIRDGACAFVRIGTHFSIMEEGVGWCLMTIFIPDDFFKQIIRDNLKNIPLTNFPEAWANHVILLEVNDLCKSFLFSTLWYFTQTPPPQENFDNVVL
jgi:hypothetical protein